MPGKYVKRWSGAAQYITGGVHDGSTRHALEAVGVAWRALRSVERYEGCALRSVEHRGSPVLAADHVLALKVSHAHLCDAGTQIVAALHHNEALLAAAGEEANGTIADQLVHTTIPDGAEKPTGLPNLTNPATPDGSSQGKQNTPAASGDGSGSRSLARSN